MPSGENDKNYSQQLSEIANELIKEQNKINFSALIVAIIALVISIWGVLLSNNNNVKEISNDEIVKAHEATIKIWDQEIDKTVNDDIISDELQLKYSNIGDGLAQDIKFEILPEEQKSIAMQCESLLDSCLTYPDNTESKTYNYAHYLSLPIGDAVIFAFWYDMFGDEIRELENVHILDEYITFDSSICNSNAYLIPILVEDRDAYITIPANLSSLVFNTLLTLKYYEEPLEKPIVFSMQVSYKDIYGSLTEDQATVELSIIDEDSILKTDKDRDTDADNLYSTTLRLQVNVNQTMLDNSNTVPSVTSTFDNADNNGDKGAF